MKRGKIMKDCRIVVQGVAVFLAGWACLFGWTPRGHAQPTKHALLVGVSHYPNLNERFSLKGPANDVVLMQDLLTRQFGFPKENVAVLSEAEGKRDEKRYPNRAHIQREFARLAKVAQAGDQVLIMMGGHGSQQPESENPTDPEPDGLDEIFLPRDVKEWDGDVGKVPNAIIDDEIGIWLRAIQVKKAFVWIVFDSCHSGTMIRGVQERERQIGMQADLKVPADAVRKAQARAAQRAPEGTRGGPASPERAPLPQGSIVAIYACQSNEVTVERELPPQSKEAKPYGLLTFTLAQILTQAQQNSGKPPSYRELVQMLNSRYSAMGRNSPTPQIEGTQEDRNREVLGTTSWTGRPTIALTEEARGWKINAGTLHGITPGSVLAVKPLADQKDAEKILGHVRVEEVKMTSATVVPTAFGTMKAQEKLPEEARCEIVHVDFGMERLKLAVDPRDDADQPLPPATVMSLAKEIDQAVAKATSMLQRVDAPEKADWLVRSSAKGILVIPASEASYRAETKTAADAKAAVTRFGPYPLDDKFADTLRERLQRIVRAENLKKLVGATEGETTRGKAEGNVQVDVNLERLPSPKDRKGLPLSPDTGKLQLHHGDTIRMTIHNPNRFAVDVTVLFIDSGYGIDVYFPNEEINRVKGSETLVLPAIGLDASKTFGLENLVVIAVKATTKEPVDFSFMAQPTLEKMVKVRGKVLGDAPKSPLESLLETNLFGSGNTRGINRRAVDEFSLRSIPWQLSPEPRGKGKK
jgi:hypothetical protein